MAKGPTVLVGGPIHHALTENSFDQTLKRRLLAIIEIVRTAADTVYSAHLVEAFGTATKGLGSEYIAARDFAWMRECDVFVAVLPLAAGGIPYRTDGTFVEVGWASAMGKPIVLLTDGVPPSESFSHLIKGLRAVAPVEVLDLNETILCADRLRKLLRQLCCGTLPELTNPTTNS